VFPVPARVPQTPVACPDFSVGPVRAGQVGFSREAQV
jgi:hypothetical protein